MKTLLLLVAGTAAFAQNWQPNVTNARFETRKFSGNLASDARSPTGSPIWFGYAVKTTSRDRTSCCWNGSNQCGCNLEAERGTVTNNSPSKTPVQLEGSDAAAILFRVANDGIQNVKVYSLSCPLDAGGLPFVWLTGVPANASLTYLQKLVVVNAPDHVLDGAILAVSQHDDPQADNVLEQFTRPAQPEKIREKATFWLGAARGARGVTILKNILANDPTDRIRDKAVFALSISKQPEALESLIHAARSDSSAHVRGQAIFWLSQKAGKRASSTITDAIEKDPDTQVKKQAVFALSQLPKDEGVPKLIDVARSQKNREVRKQAFFWLGQSQDPRALAFIEQVLTR
ncbi:MAG: HEAT repeat domain-containing protein [Bryobacteraceae bacterium]